VAQTAKHSVSCVTTRIIGLVSSRGLLKPEMQNRSKIHATLTPALNLCSNPTFSIAKSSTPTPWKPSIPTLDSRLDAFDSSLAPYSY